MSEKVFDQVVDKKRRRIDLRDQRGGLTASVIESLRTFLRYNEVYIHLNVSDNLLGSEALAELCALLKRHPHLTSVEAQHCGLQDKDFCFYFGPALISMPQLTFVDLSRNRELTDASAEVVARMFLETEVESVRLIGTSLTAAGGRVIAAAAANTTSLVNCELPFTVGSVVLDTVEAYTRRNRAHCQRLQEASSRYTRLQVSHCRLPSLPALKQLVASPQAVAAGSAASPERDSPLSPSVAATPVANAAADGAARTNSVSSSLPPLLVQNSEDRQWRAYISKGRRQSLVYLEPLATTAAGGDGAAATVAEPSSDAFSARDRHTPLPMSSPSTTKTLSMPATAYAAKRMPPPSSSLTQRAKAMPDSLGAVTMWDWADPATSNALRCLFVLDHQAQVLDHYRAAAAAPAVVVPESARRSRIGNRGRERSTMRRGGNGRRATNSGAFPPFWSP